MAGAAVGCADETQSLARSLSGSLFYNNSGRAPALPAPSTKILPPWDTLNRGEPRRQSHSLQEPHGYLRYTHGCHARTALITRQPYTSPVGTCSAFLDAPYASGRFDEGGMDHQPYMRNTVRDPPVHGMSGLKKQLSRQYRGLSHGRTNTTQANYHFQRSNSSTDMLVRCPRVGTHTTPCLQSETHNMFPRFPLT
jgi:hypothetical protein